MPCVSYVQYRLNVESKIKKQFISFHTHVVNHNLRVADENGSFPHSFLVKKNTLPNSPSLIWQLKCK